MECGVGKSCLSNSPLEPYLITELIQFLEGALLFFFSFVDISRNLLFLWQFEKRRVLGMLSWPSTGKNVAKGMSVVQAQYVPLRAGSCALFLPNIHTS